MPNLSIAALTLMLIGATLPAPAVPADTSPTWQLAAFTWIKRQPAEKGAPANGHPLRVDNRALVQAIGTVRFGSGSTEEALFAPTEAAELGKALAEALAVAGPGEDLELLSTSKRDGGLFGKSLTVTARVFAQDGKLNLIVHDARLDFMEAYFIDFRVPKFKHGSRTAAGPVVLKAAGAESRRADWVVLPLTAPAPLAAPQTPTPSAVPQVSPPPQPAATGSLEDRLRSLKRLREQDLITEEEYAKRKQELLKGV